MHKLVVACLVFAALLLSAAAQTPDPAPLPRNSESAGTTIPVTGDARVPTFAPGTRPQAFGVERRFAREWVLTADYFVPRSTHAASPFALDSRSSLFSVTSQLPGAQATCTRLLGMKFNADSRPCASTADWLPASFTDGINRRWVEHSSLHVGLGRTFGSGSSILASYGYARAVDMGPEGTSSDPIVASLTGFRRQSHAGRDERHRVALSGTIAAPFGFNVGGVSSFASGSPFEQVSDTGIANDLSFFNGRALSLHALRSRPTYNVSSFVERDIPFGERIKVRARAEASGAFNQQKFLGNSANSGAGLGPSLIGVSPQPPKRSLQFSIRLMY